MIKVDFTHSSVSPISCASERLLYGIFDAQANEPARILLVVLSHVFFFVHQPFQRRDNMQMQPPSIEDGLRP